MISDKHTLALDIECYPNFFLVMFKSLVSGKVRAFSAPGLDTEAIRNILRDYRLITFNGTHYDLPMLTLALRGASCQQLKAASDKIIQGNLRSWQFYREFGLNEPKVDHIDLLEVAPGDGSLKLYGGRLNSRKLQDLPIEPDTEVTPEQAQALTRYCENDLDTTIDLYRKLAPTIDLRTSMSEQYGVDMRSKSDAQIAEAIIKLMVAESLGHTPSRPTIPPGRTYRFQAPDFLAFQTEQMKLALLEVCASEFVIDDNGSPIEPPALAGRVVKIGSGEYRMGIGGLHSSEVCACHFADERTTLMDVDVTSFYPSIILRCGLYPEHLGSAFLRVYREIFDTRVAAKKAGNKTVNEVLKIVLNGSYGKFGSKWSALYAPDLMLQVTLTGQLSLLMLIEALELDGISVVSANTDGIVLKFPTERIESVRSHIRAWEKRTGFGMEETAYSAIFSRDVNNYVAIKAGGGVKGKGAYAEPSLSKNPQNPICVEAVKAFLAHGTPVAQTIIGCTDIRQFLTVRRVTGGAIYRGEPIGKVVRWYSGRGSQDTLNYRKPNSKGTHNKVPDSDGAVPCMALPDSFPNDVDFERYIAQANRILDDLGVKR
jgi:hypothetical protein